MGMHRSDIKRQRREDAQATRLRNRVVKDSERARRDARMVETLRAGQPPYAPVVMSWLSRKLGKRAGRITPEDIQPLINDAAAGGSARG